MFYVYLYLRGKSSTNGPAGTPYYVGKGTGQRAVKKFAGEIRPPVDRSLVRIFMKDLSEQTAFRLEKELIKIWGRIDLGTGCLHNKTEGGDGTAGLKRSAEDKANKAAAARTKWQDPAFRARTLRAMREHPHASGYKRVSPSLETRHRISAATMGRTAWNKKNPTT